MAEPTTSAGGIALAKILGGLGFGAALAAFVVMMKTRPLSQSEWAIGLATTIVGSFAGGAFAIIKLGLLAGFDAMPLVDQFMAVLSAIGLAFACGVPAWAIVKWWFNFQAKRSDKGLDEVVEDVKKVIP